MDSRQTSLTFNSSGFVEKTDTVAHDAFQEKNRVLREKDSGITVILFVYLKNSAGNAFYSGCSSSCFAEDCVRFMRNRLKKTVSVVKEKHAKAHDL